MIYTLAFAIGCVPTIVTFVFAEGLVNIYKWLHLGTLHVGKERSKLPELRQQQINFVSHDGA
jgi:hypothetical protein